MLSTRARRKCTFGGEASDRAEQTSSKVSNLRADEERLICARQRAPLFQERSFAETDSTSNQNNEYEARSPAGNSFPRLSNVQAFSAFSPRIVVIIKT